MIENEPKQLIISVFDDPLTLDPHVAYDSSSRHITLNIYESLLRYDEISKTIIPCLATQVPEPSYQGNMIEYFFPLREDVQFHNGVPMTPDDVVYSLRRVISTTTALTALWLEALLGERLSNPTVEQIISACKQVEMYDYGVKISLKHRFSPFIALVAHWSLILPRHWSIAQGDWDGTFKTLPAHISSTTKHNLATSTNGTGPFILDEWNRTSRTISFHRHKHYWGSLPDAQQVLLVSEDDRVARECSLVEGKVDFAVCQPESMKRLQLTHSLVLEESPNEWLVNPLGFMAHKLDPSCEAVGSGCFDGQGLLPEALSDRDLRLALAFSFDYQTFIEEALYGHYLNHYGAFPRVSLPEGPHPVFTYDLAQARSHLEKAWNGEAVQAGFRLIAYTHRDNFARVRAAHLHAQRFNQLHSRCSMEVRELPLTDLFPMLFSSQCPIVWLGWDADYNHPYTFAAQLLAEDALLPQTLGIKLPRVPELLQKALDAQTYEEEISIYQDIAREAIQDQTYLFVPGKVSYLSYSSQWRGVKLKDGVSNVLDFSSFHWNMVKRPFGE